MADYNSKYTGPQFDEGLDIVFQNKEKIEGAYADQTLSNLTDKAAALENLGAAKTDHNHGAGDITSGILPIERGGIGKNMKGYVPYSIIRMSSDGNSFSNIQAKLGAFHALATDTDARFGTLPINCGGTGATTAAAALTNLGAAPAYTYSTTDLTAGSSALTTGKMYLVYE